MAKKRDKIDEVKIDRPERVKLSREESLKRMREFAKRNLAQSKDPYHHEADEPLGILRLRICFASRGKFSAQDDKFS